MILPWLALAFAGLVAFLLTPPVRFLAERKAVLDRPDRRRKLHRRLVPLWGGLAIFPALVAGVALSLTYTAGGRALTSYHQGWLGRGLWWLLAAGTLLVIVGAADDRIRVPPKVKLLAHLAAAGLAVAAGFRLEEIIWPWPETILHVNPVLGAAFAVLWLTFMINAFNFIDGLDGLAPGQAVISGLALSLGAVWLAGSGRDLAAGHQLALASVLAASAAGAGLGFWRYNRPPAKIFLGDAGSTLLGFTLALAALAACGRATRPAAPLLPLLALAWPIADALAAVFRRWQRGEPVSRPDHRHLHHRLLDHGFSGRAALALVLGLGAVLAVLGLAAVAL